MMLKEYTVMSLFNDLHLASLDGCTKRNGKRYLVHIHNLRDLEPSDTLLLITFSYTSSLSDLSVKLPDCQSVVVEWCWLGDAKN